MVIPYKGPFGPPKCAASQGEEYLEQARSQVQGGYCESVLAVLTNGRRSVVGGRRSAVGGWGGRPSSQSSFAFAVLPGSTSLQRRKGATTQWFLPPVFAPLAVSAQSLSKVKGD